MARTPGLLRALLAVTAAGLAIAAADAQASRIVYVCGQDLCAVNPDGGTSAPITTDGSASAYAHPSVSRDGTRLAAARGNDVMVGAYGANLTTRWAAQRDMNDVALSPDGAAFGESHSYVENRYGCPLTGGCLELVDRSATSYAPGGAPAEATRSYAGGGGVGFLGNGALLSSHYTLSSASNTICVVVDPATPGRPCEPRVTLPTAAAASLTSPAGSPDSTLIAATVGDPAPATTTSVQLFAASTGARVGTVAANAGSPAFSPDGARVAYTSGDGWIHVTGTRGGAPRRLVRGHSPTWGDGPPPGASIASPSLRYARERIAVRVRCGGPSTCRGTARISRAATVLGSRGYRIGAGRSATVTVRPTSRGRRAIARARTHRVTVRLRGGTAATTSTTLTLRR
jgi:hypothetical protein